MGLDIDLVGHIRHEKFAAPFLRAVGQFQIQEGMGWHAIKVYAVKDEVDGRRRLTAGIGDVDAWRQRCAVAELEGILSSGMEGNFRREGLPLTVGVYVAAERIGDEAF